MTIKFSPKPVTTTSSSGLGFGLYQSIEKIWNLLKEKLPRDTTGPNQRDQFGNTIYGPPPMEEAFNAFKQQGQDVGSYINYLENEIDSHRTALNMMNDRLAQMEIHLVPFINFSKNIPASTIFRKPTSTAARSFPAAVQLISDASVHWSVPVKVVGIAFEYYMFGHAEIARRQLIQAGVSKDTADKIVTKFHEFPS